MKNATQHEPANGAESVLLGLKRNGIDYLFANAGTDFPPIIEALAHLPADTLPEPITIPHETAAVAMAHGYYLATGRPQAVMVHVNVGLANAAMGVINAMSDNVPVVVMSGRTPVTETGRSGGRMTPIQYGQEMYDQASLVRDVTKFNYELRYAEQGEPLVSRAVALAKSEPRGPVYLSLPREPLTESISDAARQPITVRPPASPAQPDPDAVGTIAGWLAEARSPVVLCQRGDSEGRLSAALSRFAARHGVAVTEPFSVRNVLASSDPALAGYDPKAAIEAADVILALDCDIPWIEKLHRPADGVRLVHIGADPHFQRMPVRGYRTDLALTSEPAAAIEALDIAMGKPSAKAVVRAKTITERSVSRMETARAKAEAGNGEPMSPEWLSRCVGEAMDENAVAFSELGLIPGSMNLSGPNRLFSNPHSGGLGWALPAALGAQLADRERLTVACMGDGSYIFANPLACHQIAEALGLPVLIVVKNNAMWNAVRRSVIGGFPGGAAAKANRMPLTSLEPLPDFVQVAKASRAHAERVERGADLPAALERAVHIIRTERRQALIDVRVAASDTF
jgi:acetolactate synthase I/II/III large subunit